MTKVSRLSLATFLAVLASPIAAQWYQGPSGGKGGAPFDFWQESGCATDIEMIRISKTATIRCIAVSYRRTRPNQVRHFWHGDCVTGFGGSDFVPTWPPFSLDPDEYLLGVSGTYGDHVDSIRFFTNKKSSPTYGGTGGSHRFGYTAPSGQMIVALIGRAGSNVDSIGVIYARCPPATKLCK